MLNRATRNAHHVLPKSRYRLNVVLVRSNGGKERSNGVKERSNGGKEDD